MADRLSDEALELLREIGRRAEVARRIGAGGERALLRSVIETTVALFDAEAASIALYEAERDQLVFVVAAGAQGEPVVGLAIPPGQGIAGFVFSTGEPIAISDPARDPRFGRQFAEQTGYVPRSLIAVPLQDDERTIGVLEVLDKRGGRFDLRDVDAALLFARQAAVAIRASRAERDLRTLLGSVVAGTDGAPPDTPAAEIVAAAVADLAPEDPFWRLVDRIAELRAMPDADVPFLLELLDLFARHRVHGRRASGRLGRLSREARGGG